MAAALAAVLLAGCGGGEGPGGRPSSEAPSERPNLIVVMTDDQTLESFGPRAMPYTWELFHDDQSTIFEQAIASPPLCCPSRAGFITGQYPHNHGVFGNVPGYAALIDKENTLPAWLKRAGYHTAFVGKYLNGYEQMIQPAPGWDSWHASFNFLLYFDYIVNDDGEVTHYGYGRHDYSTYQYTERAVAEISDPRRDKPLFMWLAYNAPHLIASQREPCDGDVPTPPSREAFEEFAGEPLPRDPSFGERDRSDKPRTIADRPPLTPVEIELMTLRWRCGLATLRALDESIERVVSALSDEGELDNTVLVFVSDNGYFFGQHAIDRDKRLPYRASAQVPMAIRVPDAIRGGEHVGAVDEVVSTVDLAPTLLDFAGGRPCLAGTNCRAIDGRSLRPLLSGSAGRYPGDRAILLELDDAYKYEALRTDRYLYSRIYSDRGGFLPQPGIELYDLHSDPYELENLWQVRRSTVRDLKRSLGARLDRLAACRGSEEERFARVEAPGDCE